MTLITFYTLFERDRKLLTKVWKGPRATRQPVANAINVLQACVYKSVNTGLFLKPLVAKSFNKLMHIFSFKYKVLKLKSMILLILAILAAAIGFKIGLYLQTCTYRPVKCL